MVFDADTSENLIRRIQSSVKLAELPEKLNCTRPLATQLVSRRIIPRIAEMPVGHFCLLKRIALDDVEAFLAAMMQNAEKVERISDGLFNLQSAAERARWPAVDIVEAILDGKLQNVKYLDASAKLGGVFVDPAEIRENLVSALLPGFLLMEDAEVVVGLKKGPLSALLGMKSEDGEPLIGRQSVWNSKGGEIVLYSADDLAAFRRDHASLKCLAERYQVGLKAMKKTLAGNGISPIPQTKKLFAEYYREEDLHGLQI